LQEKKIRFEVCEANKFFTNFEWTLEKSIKLSNHDIHKKELWADKILLLYKKQKCKLLFIIFKMHSWNERNAFLV
jgi:hypothetical protein